jgi:transcriptional regulator with XRE-family HTH domain
MTPRLGRPPGLTPDGPKIRSLRVDQGVTLTELGLRIGYHPKNLSKVERQGKPLSDVIASRLAKALGVEVADIASPPGDDTGSEPEPKALAS